MKFVFALLLGALFSTTAVGAPLNREQKKEVYLLLGMTDEYNGHQIGQPSRFYANQQLAETVYLRHAESLRALLGLHTLSEVWPLVDSFYRKMNKTSGKLTASASWEMFDDNREYTEDYLRGVLLANWDHEKRAIRFANSPSKAHLVVDLVAGIGKFESSEVQLVVFPYIPFTYDIRVKQSKRFDELVAATFRDLE